MQKNLSRPNALKITSPTFSVKRRSECRMEIFGTKLNPIYPPLSGNEKRVLNYF